MDRIDLQILKLLQQRTKLSRRIGETKRRHGAVIYVPQRERELLRRVARLSRGQLPATAVTAIYREILSSSRAAQSQPAIGLLQASTSAVLLPARWCFGACDEFRSYKGWSELVESLLKGSLVLALLTGADLGRILKAPASRRQFLKQMAVAGDFASPVDAQVPLEQRIFIITPRAEEFVPEANRMLILIECKSSVDAVKSWFNFMSERSFHLEQAPLPVGVAPSRASATLVRLTLDRPRNVLEDLGPIQAAGVPFSVLGLYQGIEDYAG